MGDISQNKTPVFRHTLIRRCETIKGLPNRIFYIFIDSKFD